MEFGINLGMPNPSLSPTQQLEDWRATLRTTKEAGFSFVSALHQWLSHPFQFLSPFPILAWMAGQFPELNFMTGVLQLPALNPAQFAEDVVTLDYLTEGRCLIGVGLGYRPDLFQAVGAEKSQRTALFEESLEIAKGLWSGERVNHNGAHFHISGQLARVPVQQPHPPIVIGAQSKGAVIRAGTLGDGWYIPSQVGEDDLDELFPIYLAARRTAGKTGAGVTVLTRNVCIADTDEAAKDHAAGFMNDTYAAYRPLGLEERTTVRVHRTFEEEITTRAVVGSVATCQRRLSSILLRYPVSHLQLRPQGPGFTGSEDGLRKSLMLLGERVLPSLV